MTRFVVALLAMAVSMELATAAVQVSYIPADSGSSCSSVSTFNVDCLSDCLTQCTNAASGCDGGVLYKRDSSSTSRCQLRDDTCQGSSGFQYFRKQTSSTGVSCGTRDYSLIILLDESGSVGSSNFEGMKDFVTSLTSSVSQHTEFILNNAQVFKFSHFVETSVLPARSDLCDFEDDVAGLSYDGGQTNIQDALLEAADQRALLPSSEKTVVVLLTDGKPTVYGQRPTIFYSREDAKDEARLAAQALVDLPNTGLVYGAIQGAKVDLFDGIDTTDIDISSWDLNNFAEQLEAAIGEVICLTDSPTKSPTPRPTSTVPTLSPTQRPTKSPTRQPTTLAPSTCTVIDSGVTTVEFPGGAQERPEDFEVGRHSSVTDTELVLTSGAALSAFTSTYVFRKNQQNLVGGFVSEFTVHVDDVDQQPEGFVFVMHRRAEGLEDMPQATGGGLGYAAIEDSISIVFDLCSDRTAGLTGICGELQARVEYNTKNASATPLAENFRVSSFLTREDRYDVRVEYLEQAAMLAVYVDDVIMFQQFGFRVDHLVGGADAFLGFTASSSEAPNRQTISAWNVRTVTIDFGKTEAVDLLAASEPKTLVADNKTLQGFTIRTVDSCAFDIRFGGFGAQFQAVFVEDVDWAGEEEGLVVSATIVDNKDGTYSAVMATDAVNRTFGLFAAYGENCNVELAEPGSFTLGSGNTSVCFWGEIAAAIVTVEPVDPIIPNNGAEFGNDDASTNIATVAASGGVAAAMLVAAALVMARYRRKWVKDKAFIDEGAIANIERDVTYSGEGALSQLGARLQASHEELSKARAEAEKTGRRNTISRLELEHQDLQQQVRAEKINAQVAGQPAAAASPAFGGARGNKKEFAAVENMI